MGAYRAGADRAFSSGTALSRPAHWLAAKRCRGLARRRRRPRELPRNGQVTTGPSRGSPNVPSAGMSRHVHRTAAPTALLPKARTWPTIGRAWPVPHPTHRKRIRLPSKRALPTRVSCDFGTRRRISAWTRTGSTAKSARTSPSSRSEHKASPLTALTSTHGPTTIRDATGVPRLIPKG